MKKLQQSHDPDDRIAIGSGSKLRNCSRARIQMPKLQEGQDLADEIAI
jgi:hypothetical protein